MFTINAMYYHGKVITISPSLSYIHGCFCSFIQPTFIKHFQSKMWTSFFLITEILQNALSWAFCSWNSVLSFLFLFLYLVSYKYGHKLLLSGTKNMYLMPFELLLTNIQCYILLALEISLFDHSKQKMALLST